MTFITIVAIMGVLGSAIYNDDLFIMFLIPFLFYVMIKQDDFEDRAWLLEEKNMGVNKISNNLTDNLSNNSPILSNSLTYAEIKKALECCFDTNGVNCGKCPYCDNCVTDENTSLMMKDVLDLINRQDQENENLKAENSNLTSDLTSLQNDLTSAKAEIERLKGCVKTEDEVRAIAKETIQAGIQITPEQFEAAFNDKELKK